MNICGILFWARFIIFSIDGVGSLNLVERILFTDGEMVPKSDGDGLHWADLTQAISVILLVGLAQRKAQPTQQSIWWHLHLMLSN